VCRGGIPFTAEPVFVRTREGRDPRRRAESPAPCKPAWVRDYHRGIWKPHIRWSVLKWSFPIRDGACRQRYSREGGGSPIQAVDLPSRVALHLPECRRSLERIHGVGWRLPPKRARATPACSAGARVAGRSATMRPKVKRRSHQWLANEGRSATSPLHGSSEEDVLRPGGNGPKTADSQQRGSARDCLVAHFF